MSPPPFPSAPDAHAPIQPSLLGSPAARHRHEAGCQHDPARAVPTSRRWCRLAPDAGGEERITAAVRVVVTAYSNPGDRVALADVGEPGTPRDRLVETVLRLARGAVTEPPRLAFDDHHWAGEQDRAGSAAESESGLGPEQPSVAEPIAPSEVHRLGEQNPDRFAVIICGCSPCPADPGLMAAWAPRLDPDGTLVVLTDSNHQARARTVCSGTLTRAAARSGLTPVERLILAHDTASDAPTTSEHRQRAVGLGAHLAASPPSPVYSAARFRSWRPVMPRNVVQPASVWVTGNRAPHPQIADRHLDAPCADLAITPAVARWIIETYTSPGEIICDPNPDRGVVLAETVRAGRHALALPTEPRWESALQANLDLARRAHNAGHATLLEGIDDPRAADLPVAIDLVLTGFRSTPARDPSRVLVGLYEDLTAIADWIWPGGHVVITCRPWCCHGRLVDLAGATHEAADAVGLIPALFTPVHRTQLRTPLHNFSGREAPESTDLHSRPIAQGELYVLAFQLPPGAPHSMKGGGQ